MEKDPKGVREMGKWGEVGTASKWLDNTKGWRRMRMFRWRKG